MNERRLQLLQLYQVALQAVAGDRVVSHFLHSHPVRGQWAVVAIGKASAAMSVGAQETLGEQFHSGLVITKYGHGDPRLRQDSWQVLESGHPRPDSNSLAAGDALLAYLECLPDELPLLFLLSGGASALVEVLPEGVELSALERVNEWLLSAGLAIDEMNTVRKRLSRIKGGRLARHLRGRRCLQLMISDVPGDDPTTIGSAPLYPSIEKPLPESLPAWLSHLLTNTEAALPADAPIFTNIETHIIASNDLARLAVSEAATAMGISVTEHLGHFQGKAERLASCFTDELLGAQPGIQLWGGESSVVLPPEPGRGGRNQHLALSAARHLAGRGDCLLLVAGTDGTDGPTEDAGALVDGGTIARGEEEGLSAERSLREADSGRFLEVSGDLIETGPTGSNVMDLVIGWKWHVD